jgi:hypothetical protein
MQRRIAAITIGILVAIAVDAGGAAVARKHRRPVLHDCGDVTSLAPPAGFEVELSLDRTTYARGQPVQLILRVGNGSGATFTHEVGYPDAVFEIVTRDKLVWSSTWAQFYPAIVFEETFAPGEEKTSAITWTQNVCRTDGRGGIGDPPFFERPAPRGTYTAYASWRGRWSAEPVTFSIVR